MLTLHQHPFELLEQQLRAAERPAAERVPAAEVHETDDAYVIALDLPGVDKASIDVKATDRTLVISAERRQPNQTEPAQAQPAPLISEIRYGTWSRSFRFPGGINRDGLAAHYRDGMLTVTAPKAQTQTTVQVQVEG